MNQLTKPIYISITDDQTLFREGLRNLISGDSDLEVLMDHASGPALLTHLANTVLHPDIALVDMDMPEMNGMELTQQLLSLYPNIKVIILSVHNQTTLIARMIQNGASAYLEKNCGSEELLETIRKVFENGFYVSKQVMEAIQKAAKMREKTMHHLQFMNLHLTDREQQILSLICKDKSTAEISELLFISPRTVEGHRQNMLTKTGCKNVAGLVLFALKNGLFHIDADKFD